MSAKKQRQSGKGALELIEEATQLLRLLPANILLFYYAGSVPFILGLLYFWADMSRNAFAHRHVAEAAFSITLLFIWMKSWHSAFTSKIKAHICKKPDTQWTLSRVLHLVANQTFIQSSGLFALPIAMVATLPLAWTYAFYQNASIYGNGTTTDVKTISKKAWQQASLFPKQNHLVLFILSVFSFFVFFNLAIVIYLAPQLLNTLLGIETVFTKARWSMLNTTFLAVTCGIVYLLMDPLVKAIYVLRCFYGESLQTGEDLKVELKHFQSSNKIVLAFLFFAVIAQVMIPSKNVLASDHSSRMAAVSPQEIDRSVNEVLSKREYAWKMPREKKEAKSEGVLAAFIDGLADTLSSWCKPIGNWLKTACEWITEHLQKLFPESENRKPLHTDWLRSVQIVLYMLLCLVSSILALLLWRMWKQRKGRKVEIAIAMESKTPDITDDTVMADELPASRWLNLAKELMEQGNMRLALRALYLASLSHLARHEMITIARFKSNRDYEKELSRKAHNMPEVLSAFEQNVRILESIWYGMHEVTGAGVESFNKNQKKIMAFGEK